MRFFLRDAENLEQSRIVVLIGSRKEPLRLPFYGYCGSIDKRS